MMVLRFMGTSEFQKYLDGEIIRSDTDWNKKHFRTNSVGVCFFPAGIENPEDRLKYISGIIDTSICAVFRTNKKMAKTFGVYRDPDHDDCRLFAPIAKKSVQEWCTPSYSKDDFTLIRYGIPDIWNHTIKWHSVKSEYTRKLELTRYNTIHTSNGLTLMIRKED